MAANMKAVKLRIKSVESTMQITKAMELVASSKLRKAKERADTCRPYFQELYRTLQDIAKGNTEFYSIYAKEAKNEKCCYVLVAGDRGLAGGYNFEIARALCREFRKGTFGHVELCYTKFVSMLSQMPVSVPILPLIDIAKEDGEDPEAKKIRNLILYEPNGVEVFEAIVPEYLGGLIYGGICESVASELAARRTAMEAATGNAEEMIEQLNLYYNRARQASITQEITEIVGGAEGV